MANTTYGTGTALQFSDASQRQVLELGSKIHYYNPNVTPIFSLFGMKSVVTPVPIFEWMEDEYMIKKSVIVSTSAAADVQDTDNTGTPVNKTGGILKLNRLSQQEMFERGGVYKVTAAGNVSANSMSHLMCVAIGKEVNHASPIDRYVQFVGIDAISGSNVTYDEHANSAAILSTSSDHAGTLTFEFVGIAQQGSISGKQGYEASQTNLTNNDVFALKSLGGYAEGAGVGVESRKKVRRLKNCTQIFREPYTVTGTAKASKHYGGSEMSRLQARKLAKIKGDIEWAILSNGAISLDASAENPQRTFQGIGLGSSDGSISSLNGYDDSNLRLSNDTGTIAQFDALCEYIFSDMVSGSMKKTVFASNKWLVKMASMTRAGDTGNFNTGEVTKAGLRVRSYLGAVGELEFIPHPYLKGAYEDYAVAIDPANFAVRPLAGRDMQLRKDIVKDGRDGQTDEWLMEAGVEIRNEQTHAVLKLS